MSSQFQIQEIFYELLARGFKRLYLTQTQGDALKTLQTGNLYENEFALDLEDYHLRTRSPNPSGPISYEINSGAIYEFLMTQTEALILIKNQTGKIFSLTDIFKTPREDFHRKRDTIFGNHFSLNISKLNGGLPLNCVQKVIVDQNISVKTFTKNLRKPARKEILNFIMHREDCPPDCKCRHILKKIS